MRPRKALDRLVHHLYLRQRLSIVSPDYTLRAIAIILLSLTAAAALLLAFGNAYAEESIPTTTLYVCTESGPLNVRERPGLHSEVVGWLDRGEAAEVIRIENGWALVKGVGEDGTGWASTKYLGDRPPVGEVLNFTVEED